jgi:hypothetical protein
MTPSRKFLVVNGCGVSEKIIMNDDHIELLVTLSLRAFLEKIFRHKICGTRNWNTLYAVIKQFSHFGARSGIDSTGRLRRV